METSQITTMRGHIFKTEKYSLNVDDDDGNRCSFHLFLQLTDITSQYISKLTEAKVLE